MQLIRCVSDDDTSIGQHVPDSNMRSRARSRQNKHLPATATMARHLLVRCDMQSQIVQNLERSMSQYRSVLALAEDARPRGALAAAVRAVDAAHEMALRFIREGLRVSPTQQKRLSPGKVRPRLANRPRET